MIGDMPLWFELGHSSVCAGGLTVWSHAQGMFPLRQSIAEMLRLAPEAVRCVHTEGAGCYGHNGADDAAADAALITHVDIRPPVRVQWMREQEHIGEPYGPAMLTKAQASLDASGAIVDWRGKAECMTLAARPLRTHQRQVFGLMAALAAGEARGITDVLAAVTPGGGKSLLPVIAGITSHSGRYCGAHLLGGAARQLAPAGRGGLRRPVLA